MIANVIFDLDNTLVSTQVYAQLYEPFLCLVRRETGMDADQVNAYAERQGLYRNPAGRWDSGELAQALGLLELYYSELQRGIRNSAGIRQPIAACFNILRKRGIRTGIASNSFLRTIQLYLEILELKDRVDFLYSSDLAGCSKRDPRYWQGLIEGCKLQPGESLMVGDSFEDDIYWPARLGFYTIRFSVEEGFAVLQERILQALDEPQDASSPVRFRARPAL